MIYEHFCLRNGGSKRAEDGCFLHCGLAAGSRGTKSVREGQTMDRQTERPFYEQA